MASYYVDGTIVSATGTGSGTQADPWGKTDNLLQYAGDQILAGPGKGTEGDTIFIVAGDVNSTTTPMLDFTNSDFVRLTIVGRGRELTEWDCGTQNYMTSYSSSNPAGSAGNGCNLRVCNLTVNWQDNIGNVGTYNSLTGRSTHFIDCDLLLYNSSSQTGIHGRVNAHNQYCNIINCRWYKGYMALDSRSSSLTINSVIKAAPSPSYERHSYGGRNINCLFDWSGAANAGNVRGVCDYSPLLLNCSFYMGSTDRIMTIANFDNAQIINCYQEGGKCVIQHPYAQNWSYDFLHNVFAYNLTDAIIGSHGTLNDVAYTQNLVELTSTGFRDAANGDFRPNDNLIGVSTAQIPSWDLVNLISQRPTIGCYTAQNLIGKPFHPRVRG